MSGMKAYNIITLQIKLPKISVHQEFYRICKVINVKNCLQKLAIDQLVKCLKSIRK